MKKSLASLICAVAVLAASAAQDLAGKKILFLGDSITQGGGYVSFIAYYLDRLNPEKNFDIYSLGLSSETTSGLSEASHMKHGFPRPCVHERLDRVLKTVQPEIVFALYGINDGIYEPLDPVRTKAFQDGILSLVDKCRKAGAKKIYLITPPIYDLTPVSGQFNYDTVMAAYAAWETTLKIEGVEVIDLHTVMRKARDASAEPFSKDKVHPGETGHLLMARTILSGLGVQVPDEPLAKIKADPIYGLVAKRRGLRANAWLRYIGYTREKTVKTDSVEKEEAEAAELQKQIDALRRK